jgi:hypothetical protein
VTDQNSRAVADELEIRNLVARLGHLADRGEDLDEYLDCFVDEAVWDLPGNGEVGAARNVGREAIRADRQARRDDKFQGPGTNTRHLNTNLVVRVFEDGTAEAESYWMFVRDTAGKPTINSMGRYFDRFRRTDQGWKYTSRQISPG